MVSREQILARVFTEHEIAVHLAKEACHDVSEGSRRNWEATVAEGGIELDGPGQFVVALENGQSFTVTVAERVPSEHPEVPR